MKQLRAEDCGLKFIKSAIEPPALVIILARLTVIAKHSKFSVELWIASGDRSCITAGTKVFCGVEAEAAQMSHAARFLAFIKRSVGLGRVLDHVQTVLRCDG